MVLSRWLLVFLLCACGGSSPRSQSPASRETAGVVSAEQPEPYSSPVVTGQIERAQLIPVLDAGLGRFLQGIHTEPEVRDGDFVGFRIVQLYPEDERFTALDLQPGDTVVRVNGESIARPEHALRVWESLRVASQLLIQYRKGEELRELRFEIVD